MIECLRGTLHNVCSTRVHCYRCCFASRVQYVYLDKRKNTIVSFNYHNLSQRICDTHTHFYIYFSFAHFDQSFSNRMEWIRLRCQGSIIEYFNFVSMRSKIKKEDWNNMQNRSDRLH